MENKINVAELIKDCSEGMELDCTMYDNCTYAGIEDVGYIDILINTPSGRIRLTKEGCYIRHDDNAKCVIFPKGKTTWEGFIPPRVHKIDFKPFEPVLVRDNNDCVWKADFYSHYESGQYYWYICVGDGYNQCIPYNEETAHLIGTINDCPDKYKIWKDK